ncbi:MAG: polysaccharide deacetylase family protein [Candidatus Latescibacterota bacterium]
MGFHPSALLKQAFLKIGFDHILRHIYADYGTILCFHQVYPLGYRSELQKRISDTHFTPEGLDSVLKWFSEQGYEFVSMDDVPILLRKKKKRFVALTFDDGYRDNLLYALPVLKQYDAPMNIYVSTAKPENNIVLWIFILDRVITEHNDITTDEMGSINLPCRTIQEKKAAFSYILDHVLFHPDGQLNILKRILGPYNNEIGLYKDLLIKEYELQELDRDPIVFIGAHGINHSNIAALSDENAADQFVKSKNQLETILGHTVRHFAYPYGGPGYAGQREFLLAADAGFITAVTTRHAHLYPAHKEHLTALPRIMIGPSVMNDPSLIRFYAHGVTSLKINRGRRIIVK